MILFAFAFAFTVCFSTTGFSQPPNTASTDTLHYHQSPSLPLEALAGLAGYALPFWATGGRLYIKTGDHNIHAPMLGIVGTGLAISIIGDMSCNCDKSYGPAIGGAVLGILFGGPLFRHFANHNANSYILPYFALSLPSTILAIVAYHLDRYGGNGGYSQSPTQITIYTTSYLSQYGIGIQVTY